MGWIIPYIMCIYNIYIYLERGRERSKKTCSKQPDHKKTSIIFHHQSEDFLGLSLWLTLKCPCWILVFTYFLALPKGGSKNCLKHTSVGHDVIRKSREILFQNKMHIGLLFHVFLFHYFCYGKSEILLPILDVEDAKHQNWRFDLDVAVWLNHRFRRIDMTI